MKEFFVWWTRGEERDAISDGDLSVDWDAWPTWMRSEYSSLLGRSGRGRLWVAEGMGDVSIAADADWDTPLGIIAQKCGGVVITAAELPLLATLPGMVTDLKLRRIEAKR